MMASHRCLWALMLLVCLGGSYVLTAPADIPVEEGGPENVVASQGNPVCDTNGVMSSTFRCTDPVNVNDIAAENDLKPCDCPEFFSCKAIKIGESYECESQELVMAEQEDLLKFNMNFVDTNAE